MAELNNINLAQIYGAVDDANARKQQIAIQQQQLQRQGIQDQRADQEYGRQQQLRDIYAGAIKPDGTLDEDDVFKKSLAVDPASALQFKQSQQKQRMEADKLKRENSAADLTQKTATAKYLRDQLANVTDEPSYQAAIAEAKSLGGQFANSAPPTFNPDWVRSHVMDADKFLTQTTPKYEKVDLGGKIQIVDMNPVTNPAVAKMNLNKTQTPDSIASGQIQMRGQNMANQRASEANYLKSQENEIKRGEKVPENSTGIRKEFDQLPEVKNYKQALPAYKGIEEAVNRNTPQSDINLVYGIAKLYDPNSVVREGEYATVANSPNIPDKIKGYAQYIAGGSKLTPDVKQQILREAQGRMKGFEDQYSTARTNYSDIAKRSNADPTLVLPGEFKSAITAPIKDKETPKANTAIVPIKSDADFNKLPKGTRFKAPDGTIRIKQ